MVVVLYMYSSSGTKKLANASPRFILPARRERRYDRKEMGEKCSDRDEEGEKHGEMQDEGKTKHTG